MLVQANDVSYDYFIYKAWQTVSEALRCHMIILFISYASVPVPQVEGSCNCYLPLEKAWQTVSEALTCHMIIFIYKLCKLSSRSYFLLNYAPFEIVFSILRCAMENILFQTLLFNKKYSSPKRHCRVPL